jgi:WD40 repeat protein
LKVWDLGTGKDLRTLEGHISDVKSVAFSPDGSRIASASRDRTVKVWDAGTGKNLFTLEGHTNWVNGVAFSPDGSRIASGSRDTTIKVWDAGTGQQLLTLKGHVAPVTAVAFSRDGSRLASASDDRTLKAWDAGPGQEPLTLKGHVLAVTSLAFNRDGSRLASASTDGTLKVWDARRGEQQLSLPAHTFVVSAVAFSHDGSRIASGGWEKVVKVCDARNGQTLLTLEGHESAVGGLAFDPTGARLASGSSDNTVQVWDARTGKALFTLRGHQASVLSVAYSPDGSRIASGSYDKTVKIWDARTGKELLTLKGHATGVRSVAYSPDGSRIFGADVGSKVLAWDARSGNLLTDAPRAMPAGSAFATLTGQNPFADHADRRAHAEGDLVHVERIRSADDWRRYHLDEGRVEAFLGARRDRRLHVAEAERMERTDALGAAFHLDRLLALSPDDRPVLLKRRSDILSAALKADPNDHAAARALARQAVADPATVPDATSLLPVLARHPHAALDRLHGALLLRTGNARDAAQVFRAAILNRTNKDEPPIDELLLALALVKLDRREEARHLLTKASEWMDEGTTPQRVALLLAARPAGPLAALTAIAHVPDVRLNPLDPFTAHELYVLRREVETALGVRARDGD